jgi:serine phosphatase RsbU (regulator of sigma subunit)
MRQLGITEAVMFFKKPPPPPATPTAEERAALARQQQFAKLQQALEKDPAFQIMTVDELAWICPYTGNVIDAPFGFIEPALKYLLDTQPWTKTKLKAVEQLQAVRWLAWLRQQLPDETRLQIFHSDRRWLNPFSGQWERLQRLHTTFSEDCIKDIAVALSRCPVAAKSKASLLPSSKLMLQVESKKQEACRHDLDLRQASTAVHATVRRSGVADTKGADGKGAGTSFDEDLLKANSIIQKMLAPMPIIPGYGVMVHYEPHSTIGGDFYECMHLGGGRFLLAVGDVTGHGIQGAMVVVAALKSLRHVLKQTQDLVEVLARLNDDLKADLLSGQFITVFAAILDAPAQTLTCVCAGHHAGLRACTTRAAVMERIGLPGPAIGLVKGDMLRSLLHPQTIALAPGDVVCVYTDGLSEAANQKHEEYGDWRAMGCLLSAIDKPYDEAVSRLVAESRTWAGGKIADDLTVLALAVDRPPRAESREPRAEG